MDERNFANFLWIISMNEKKYSQTKFYEIGLIYQGQVVSCFKMKISEASDCLDGDIHKRDNESDQIIDGESIADSGRFVYETFNHCCFTEVTLA